MTSDPSVIFPLVGKRIFVAGHSGMVGSALVRRLQRVNCEILSVGHDKLDLRRQTDTEAWLAAAKPDVVFIAAALVGGIQANSTRPAEFLYDNLAIATNIIEASRLASVKKLMFLGSSCIYPRDTSQPIIEEALGTGTLEPTNQWYAIAKIAGIKLCAAYRKQYGCDFIAAQPTSIYGPGDNFDLNASHVIPALIAKAHRAKIEMVPEFPVWGTGKPRREFLHVDDLADALVHLMERHTGDALINIGWGKDISIHELVGLVMETVGYKGAIRYLTDKPDGTPRKLLNTERLNAYGWRPKVQLPEGLAEAYRWYLANVAPE